MFQQFYLYHSTTLLLLASNILKADTLDNLVFYNKEISRIIKSLNKFNKLFNLTKFLVILLLLLLLTLLFSILTIVRIKFFNNLVDKYFKH